MIFLKCQDRTLRRLLLARAALVSARAEGDRPDDGDEDQAEGREPRPRRKRRRQGGSRTLDLLLQRSQLGQPTGRS